MKKRVNNLKGSEYFPYRLYRIFFPRQSREVLTRHVETEMTCCCVDTINNRRLFSLIKEQRRAIEKMSGGRADFLKCHAIYQYYAAIDWQIAIDVLSTPVLHCSRVSLFFLFNVCVYMHVSLRLVIHVQ